jgi:myo-inositol 2-dehydrogenase/D-chiro-inositol 1-dehydrogenase
MIRFALIGAGRIGQMHTANIVGHDRCSLKWIYDVNSPSSEALGVKVGAKVARDPDEIFSDTEVDAIFVASSTPTHADFIVRSVQSGKAVLCEKPIDLDIVKVEECQKKISGAKTLIQIGFNRRFDPGHGQLVGAIRSGEIGDLEQVIISSRDPEPPPKAYYLAAGGMLRDMTIHDFDLARFALGEEVTEISAFTSNLFDPVAREIGEIDSAMILMKTASGKLCHINNSRHATYGYDQRLEVHGSLGMLRSENRQPTSVERFNEKGSQCRDICEFFFIERYRQAYLKQLEVFMDTLEQGSTSLVSFEDGRRALILANAAYRSVETGKVVAVSYENPLEERL